MRTGFCYILKDFKGCSASLIASARSTFLHHHGKQTIVPNLTHSDFIRKLKSCTIVSVKGMIYCSNPNVTHNLTDHKRDHTEGGFSKNASNLWV